LKHLALLKREGLIASWHDRETIPGTTWRTEIDQHLRDANIILLLVSPDFIASDYCYSEEMYQAVRRHEQGTAIVVPIILRPVDWTSSPLGKLQALPPDARPITTSSSRDTAFMQVAQGIRTVVKTMRHEDHD
jgi:hypothetical protein